MTLERKATSEALRRTERRIDPLRRNRLLFAKDDHKREDHKG
jgi:hypothetical protein